MKKNRTEDEIDALRIAFDNAIPEGNLSLADAVRAMRKITGMTQPEYSKFLHIAERTLMDIESGRANPTMETLNKIGKPFGLEINFIKKL